MCWRVHCDCTATWNAPETILRRQHNKLPATPYDQRCHTAQVLDGAQDLDAGGLVSLTSALSAAEHESEKSGALLKAIAAGALDLIPSFAPGQAAALLASFSALRHYDEAMYRAVSGHLAGPGVLQLQPQEQAGLLLALARMVRPLLSHAHHLGDAVLAACTPLVLPQWLLI